MANAARLAAVGTLAAGVAHEIKNPLNAINTGAAALRRRSEITPLLQAEVLEMIEECVGRIAEITTALDASSTGLRETLESGTRLSVDALVGTNEQLRDELGGMLGRLGEANKLMQQIVNGANKNLAAVESSLSTRVGELQTVIGTVMEEANRASQQVATQVAELHYRPLGLAVYEPLTIFHAPSASRSRVK